MKKHSFSLSSKPSSSSSKPNNLANPNPSLGFTQEDDHDTDHDHDSRHEFLTEFVPSDPKPSINRTLQIPRMENTWNWKPKMRNLDLPIRNNAGAGGDLKFEAEPAEAPSAVADSGPNISFGLNLRSSNGGDDTDTDGNRKGETFKNTESLLLHKLREDLSNLPDERLEDYNDAPVEGFGAAVLRAYGWCEEKDKKEGVKVAKVVKRGDREGLGFDRVRERGVVVGKVMRVVGGRHLGLKGKVVGKLGGEEEERSRGLRVVLKLLSSGEEVTAGGDEVAELGSLEEEMCLKKLEELKNGESKEKEKSRNSSRDDGDRRKDSRKEDNKRKREERRSVDENGGSEKRRNGTHKDSSGRSGGGGGGGGSKGEEKDSKRSWLTNHIRVRIISKDLKGGKLYLKKGVVVDVVGPKVCDISMDDGKELIQGVREDFLETALPRREGPILILSGRHKGVYGNLMEKDLEKETGVVRDADSHGLINVHLDQVAEFVGDPSDIGY